MLEKVDLSKKLSKESYKQVTEPLKQELARLQQSIKENKLPIIVLFEGWSASGKGSLISDMILTLDPRYFNVYSTIQADQAERRKPTMWRHWNKLPAQGQMSIFDRSWYQDVSVEQIEQVLEDDDVVHRMDNINIFERQQFNDGCLIIKFFLHIDQEEQKQRLDKLSSSSSTQWRVTKQDKKRNRQYSIYYEAFDKMLAYTNTAYAPWHIISSHDRRSAMSEIYQILVDSIKQAVEQRQQGQVPQYACDVVPKQFHLVDVPKLADIKLHKALSKTEYEHKLGKAQKTLAKLHNELYQKQIPVVIVYEGWDAAGKGGNIKRVSAALDPRGYQVTPISAPDKYEAAHHYLWRFWKQLPKTGHIGIFDRSWYGRVLVERVEGFCTQEQWQRAYQEINEFERGLYDWGAVVVKFWLQIDQDEQLKRFTNRQNTPEKQWKITEEDWRNREKWDEYETAVDEMIEKTSTDFAPWHIIESQDKKFARIKTIQILIDQIEKRLK